MTGEDRTTPRPDTLDAAWAAAEAALPEGWAISELRNQGTQWFARAEVWQPYATGQYERAVGSTPAAALLALAETLREARP